MYHYNMKKKSPAGSSIRLERLSHKQGVPGSSPGQPTIYQVNMHHQIIHTNTPATGKIGRCHDSRRDRDDDSCYGRTSRNGRKRKISRSNAGNRRCLGSARRDNAAGRHRRVLSPSSSVGQSNGLLSRGSEVRVLSGVPLTVPQRRT